MLKNVIKSISRYLYLIIFICLVAVPLYFTNTEKNVKSDLDNRVLVEFPKVGVANYEKGVEKYLQDRIGFRSEMVTGYQILNDKVVGELMHPTYERGKDGYIFFHMHDNVVYGNFHKTFAEAVKKMQDYCESRNVPFYFLFDPEKISVYRRYLPPGVDYNDKWVDEMLAYMRELGVRHVISNRDLLIEKSKTEQVFNVRYDAGHWNDIGCFYGTNNLWNTMHEDFPAVTEYSLDDFEISTNIGQYLANSKFSVNEEVPSFTLKTKLEVLSGNYTGIRLHNNHRVFNYYVNQADDAGQYPRTMIFHGSYYNRAPRFFVGRTSEYIGIHDYQNVLNLDYYFNIFQPDAVVFEVAEYTITDNFFDSKKMTALDFNPGLLDGIEDTGEAIQKAKEDANKIDTTIGLCLEPGTGFDTIYFDTVLQDAKYVYLFIDDKIFDMIKDEYGTFTTDIPHDAVGKNATVYYVSTNRKSYYFDTVVQDVEDFVRDIRFGEGASFYEEESKYVFVTEVEDNRFNQVNLQLLDSLSGKFIRTIASMNGTGTKAGIYIHEDENGLYTIRLKGNTNIRDVGMDISVFLQKNKQYQYSYDVISIEEKKVVVTNFVFIGPHAN